MMSVVATSIMYVPMYLMLIYIISPGKDCMRRCLLYGGIHASHVMVLLTAYYLAENYNR